MSDSSSDDPSAGLEATALAASGTLHGVGAARTMSRPSTGDALAPGTALGHFVIERKVGAGGMGEVYAAHDPHLDRRVAIKVLRPSGRGSDAATRLVREAQALAKLAHPNVVAVYEVGEAAGRVFLAMQFVEGETLGDHLTRTRPPWGEIVRLYAAAGRGLAAAHAAGLIHRDVKPGNVLIDRAGHVAVTDFGVARAADDVSQESPMSTGSGPGVSTTGRSVLSSNMTQAGAVIGTPAYMAPEQHQGRRATAASDQFSFCVSLWQGLFGAHPYVPLGHGEITSPFEYMTLVTDGALVPPPGGHKVPRRIVRALERGLAREPAARWATMDELLAELEPRSPYRAAVIALTAVATIGAGAAVLLAVTRGDQSGPSCASQSAERVATAFGASDRAAIAAGFATTGRPYATPAAAAATAALERYRERFVALATDACAAPAGDRLVAARRQCLDRALASMRTVVRVLADAPRGEVVDNATTIVGGLPALDECADVTALAAVGAPPADRADAITALGERLAAVRARADAGLFTGLDAELATLAADADRLDWAPLRAQARLVRGDVALSTLVVAGPVLREAAAIATEHHLEREATRAWMALMQVAAADKQPDALEVYYQVALATARATGDAVLSARARVRHGRALVRVRKFAEAEAECRAVYDAARANPAAEARDVAVARDCLLEALVPAGRWAEVDVLGREAIAERGKLMGDSHPAIADYLRTIAGAASVRGDMKAAQEQYRRAADIRRRAFGDQHIRYAESLGDLADFEEDPAKQQKMLEDAVAIAAASDSSAAGLIERNLQTGLADLAMRRHDTPAMRRHFERALELARQTVGPESVDVAVVMLGYGQYLTATALDEGLAKLREAIAILDKLKNPRVNVARAALAMALHRADRTAEALPVLEATLRDADPRATEPFNLALMKFTLAQALVATKGDRARARSLATEARDQFATLGPRGAESAKDVTAWLRKHR